jgi:S1-C subfamily serine protease
MGLDAKGGLLVQSVDSDSFAEDIGLAEKDVILSINRQPVDQRGRRPQDPRHAEAG